MKFSKDDIDGVLPNLRNLVDPRVEQRLFEAFRRVYEIMFVRLEEQKKDFDQQLNQIAEMANTNINSLVGVFPQPLSGSPNADPELQSMVGSFGSPQSNTFLAGPIPTFKQISIDDLGFGIVGQGEYLKKIGTGIAGGFPIGTTVLAEGNIPTVEGILYTTPATHRTLIRTLVLENISGGSLTVTLRVRDLGGIQIYMNAITMGAGPIKLVLNLILEAGYTFRADTSIADAMSYSLFGSEEPL